MNAKIHILQSMPKVTGEKEGEAVAPPFIQVDALTKTYRSGLVRALDAVNLTVSRGEVFGLIGTNGAGKTTLMGCLLGLLRPDSGSVRIDGKSPVDMDVLQITGYMPERPDFEHWMTARQFLTYHHMLSGQAAETREDDIESVLRRVELQESAWERRLSSYSRGMLQRLNLAQLLIGRPQIIFLDEPTLGLDPSGVAVFRKVLTECRNDGTTAIVNSHQLDEIERVCCRVAFIKQGRIESIESLSETRAMVQSILVRWANSYRPCRAEITSIAGGAGIAIRDSGPCWARFAIDCKSQRSELIRRLVEAGVPVEEAISEHEKLERLFERVAEAG